MYLCLAVAFLTRDLGDRGVFLLFSIAGFVSAGCMFILSLARWCAGQSLTSTCLANVSEDGNHGVFGGKEGDYTSCSSLDGLRYRRQVAVKSGRQVSIVCKEFNSLTHIPGFAEDAGSQSPKSLLRLRVIRMDYLPSIILIDHHSFLSFFYTYLIHSYFHNKQKHTYTTYDRDASTSPVQHTLPRLPAPIFLRRRGLVPLWHSQTIHHQ